MKAQVDFLKTGGKAIATIGRQNLLILIILHAEPIVN